MDKREAVALATRYSALVKNELNPQKIVLFGSHANGCQREDSDIDIAVIFKGFAGDWLDTSALLWRLRRDISFDIEPILLDEDDDKIGFAKEIMRTGMVI